MVFGYLHKTEDLVFTMQCCKIQAMQERAPNRRMSCPETTKQINSHRRLRGNHALKDTGMEQNQIEACEEVERQEVRTTET